MLAHTSYSARKYRLSEEHVDFRIMVAFFFVMPVTFRIENRGLVCLLPRSSWDEMGIFDVLRPQNRERACGMVQWQASRP